MLAVKIPASKSMSHRLLMGAALGKGTSVLRNVLLSKDIECTMQVLAGVGAKFEHVNDAIHVHGMHGVSTPSEQIISCYMHESGTSCRLLLAILAARKGVFYIHGAPRLHERPIGALATALTELGVQIKYDAKSGFLPLTLTSDGFTGESAHINIDESSQYLSGLLLAAAYSAKGLTIYTKGEKVVSWPYVALTLKTLQDFGISVQVQEKKENNWENVDWRTLHEIAPSSTRFLVPTASFKSGEFTVESDWSAASYFLAAGLVGKKSLRIQGLDKNSMQGDKAMLDIITAMQGKYAWEGDDIIVSPSKLSGIDVDMSHCPDLVPTVAVLAAFAHGVTNISNVAHLRIKESDRLAAPCAELRKVGVCVDILDDGLRVHGLGKVPLIPENTVFSAHNDHRIAMSCALLGLNGQKVVPIQLLDEPTVVQKSFPNFWELWEYIAGA